MGIITLLDPDSIGFSTEEKVYREGIELEKGVVLTPDFVEAHQDLIEKYTQFFLAYPDVFLDIIKPSYINFNLYPFQRVILRACMRYNTIFITACRAASKTFLSILAKYLQCVFVPGHNGSIVAPNKNQAAKISQQKIKEIWKLFPLLEKEVEKANMGKDYTDIKFKNGSTLSIAAALDSDRGLRKHSCLVDETRDQDGEALAEIILPQLNVSRRMANGEVNPHEMINQQVIYTTSAGLKSSFAYEKLIEVFEDSIIDPKRSFSVGLDYRIPVMHGLVSQDYVNKLKTSATYNENTFAAEYMSSWQGGSVESWFNYDKVSKYRTLKNAERECHVFDGQNSWYLLSVDVGRISDQTVVCVFKVSEKNNTFYSSLVYIEVLGRTPETKLFTKQAIDLKRLIKKFSPREVVVDINGLGVGIGDELIKTQVDEYGELYPAYGFINDETYRKVQPKDAPQILFGIKANAQLNSQIHGNAYSRTNSGKVRFLVREQEAKAALLATKRGQKMTLAERTQFLMPYEMTTSLFNEILNLRLKHTGNINDIALERINSRFPKDKYSAFSYGLWRIKELEEAHYKFLNRSTKKKQLIYFSGGS